MKKYIILAGVNGAGKSTLFSTISSFDEIEKINFDEIVRVLGHWKDKRVLLEAGKIVINRVNDCFAEGISFSRETTLCGKSIINSIKRAKELGYNIEMHYIGLNNVDIAKERVRKRVELGGHGISDDDIERRYIETFDNLKLVLPLCDLAALYDNTEYLRRFAIYKSGNCVRLSHSVPQWYTDNLCSFRREPL